MTNETKSSSRRQAIEIVAVLLAVALVLTVPVTRVALGISAQAAADMVGQVPPVVAGWVSSAWNWLF